jgi:hypothetical protein
MSVPIASSVKEKVFDPDRLAAMSAVFVEVCGRLALRDKADPATRFVAQKIIELASTGDCDEKTLRRATFRAFDVRD